MSKIGGGSRTPLLSTLRQFGWVEADGSAPTDAFAEFVHADDQMRRSIMAAALRRVYPDVFAGDVDLKTITVPQLENKIAPESKGDTLRKSFAFFVAAAEYAGIELGQFAKKQRGGARNRRTKKPKARLTDAGNDPITQQVTPVAVPDGMVRVPIALTPERTWYVEIERTHTPEDVSRFARILQIVLGGDKE